MATYSLIGAQFDDSRFFDDNLSFDSDKQTNLPIEVTFTLNPPAMRYIAREVRELNINVDIEGDLDLGIGVDLLPLIPSKFHSSIMMRDFIDSVSQGVGQWLGKISDLRALQDPYSVGEEYIGFLAALIGLEFLNEENFNIQQLRNQLLGAIDWYKLKGTYSGLRLISRIYGFEVIIYDMYTNDYETFVDEPWFVADYPEENPPGLDSSYYKSPHFGYEIQLNVLYGEGSTSYLWINSMYEGIPQRVEQIRPANTVPHIRALLTGFTHSDGQVYGTAVNVYTVITPNWDPENRYFDQSPEWNFDDGVFFDNSDDAFLSAVTKFKVGIGNKGVIPYTSETALADVVYEGAITSHTVYDDRVEYLITIPAELAIVGLSELGLFLNDNTTMVAMSTFPDTDKTAGLELRMIITIYI